VKTPLPWPDAVPGKGGAQADADTKVKNNAGRNGDTEEMDQRILPPLAQGTNPLDFITGPLDEILKDPVLNPKRKRLSALETALAGAELTRAQGELNTLDSEIRLEVVQGMEKLRPQGAFIEYAPGDNYLKEEGVLTAGEKTPEGGLRMFYLRPIDFPDIYEKKMKKEQIAEAALRRLLGILEL
jgi:hypothetical protein